MVSRRATERIQGLMTAYQQSGIWGPKPGTERQGKSRRCKTHEPVIDLQPAVPRRPTFTRRIGAAHGTVPRGGLRCGQQHAQLSPAARELPRVQRRQGQARHAAERRPRHAAYHQHRPVTAASHPGRGHEPARRAGHARGTRAAGGEPCGFRHHQRGHHSPARRHAERHRHRARHARRGRRQRPGEALHAARLAQRRRPHAHRTAFLTSRHREQRRDRRHVHRATVRQGRLPI